jgi:hypothetical protein
VKIACDDLLRTPSTIRFCVDGGIAISGSSIAKITVFLASAIIESRASTSMLIVPLPW